jgi:hypothetical protein
MMRKTFKYRLSQRPLENKAQSILDSCRWVSTRRLKPVNAGEERQESVSRYDTNKLFDGEPN